MAREAERKRYPPKVEGQEAGTKAGLLMGPGERIGEEEGLGERKRTKQRSELNIREKVYLKVLSRDFLDTVRKSNQ